MTWQKFFLSTLMHISHITQITSFLSFLRMAQSAVLPDFTKAWATIKAKDFLDADHAWSKLSPRISVSAVHSVDPATPKAENHLRVVCISDTHSLGHKELLATIPDGDILIHAGDFSNVGEQPEIEEFNRFLGQLPHRHKVVIAGNHDITLDAASYERLKTRFHRAKVYDPKVARETLTNCTYLDNSGCVVEGLQIYGVPQQPEFYDWAFNEVRGDPIQKYWDNIPDNTDILITHGPPVGFGDLTTGHVRAGCVNLLKEVQLRVKPKFHVFGHIHEGYGASTDGQTVFVNPSTCTIRYRPTNSPFVFDIPRPVASESCADRRAEE